MRTPLLLMALILAGCQVPASPARPIRTAPASGLQARTPQAAPQILLKFKAPMRGPALSSFLARYGARQVDEIPALQILVLELPAGQDPAAALKALNASPEVEFAELNNNVGLGLQD
jgi:hypothetical protein